MAGTGVVFLGNSGRVSERCTPGMGAKQREEVPLLRFVVPLCLLVFALAGCGVHSPARGPEGNYLFKPGCSACPQLTVQQQKELDDARKRLPRGQRNEVRYAFAFQNPTHPRVFTVVLDVGQRRKGEIIWYRTLNLNACNVFYNPVDNSTAAFPDCF